MTIRIVKVEASCRSSWVCRVFINLENNLEAICEIQSAYFWVPINAALEIGGTGTPFHKVTNAGTLTTWLFLMARAKAESLPLIKQTAETVANYAGGRGNHWLRHLDIFRIHCLSDKERNGVRSEAYNSCKLKTYTNTENLQKYFKLYSFQSPKQEEPNKKNQYANIKTIRGFCNFRYSINE